MNPWIVAAGILSLAAPWLFLGAVMLQGRRSERMWRETLVYLKSASAYEAEDNIDRIERRGKGIFHRALEKKKKESETLAQAGGQDMAGRIRSDLQKQYGVSDTGTGK